MDIDRHTEDHHASSKAKYIKNIIYGGIDGIITTFSIIAACFGANLDVKYIITMGVANLIADGFSMGFGDFISSFFETKYILSEKDKESYEFENNRDYEVNEMVELYEREGLDKQDARKMVDILVSNPLYQPFFIKSMVSLELGLEIPDDNYNKEIRTEALVTFFSFLVFGFIPLLAYLIGYWSNNENESDIFIIDCFITTMTIAGLGCLQAHITKQSKLKGMLILTANGIVSTSIAFGLGFGLERILN